MHPTEHPRWTKRVTVAPERLTGWLNRFRASHGATTWQVTDRDATLSAADGAHARLVNQWEPLADGTGISGEELTPGALIRHLECPRRVGIILGRKGAHAVGIAAGTELAASKVDRTYVQGRTKAGGWSQQRYARRRGNQHALAVDETIERCLERLLPEVDTLDGLVCGGDAAFITQVLEDRRLAPLVALRTAHPVLPVPDPRQEVLREFIATMRAVPIDLDEAAQRR